LRFCNWARVTTATTTMRMREMTTHKKAVDARETAGSGVDVELGEHDITVYAVY
jgi:hypothetical protein